MKLLHIDSSILAAYRRNRRQAASGHTGPGDNLPGPRGRAGAAFVWLHSCRAAAGSWAAERGGGA